MKTANSWQVGLFIVFVLIYCHQEQTNEYGLDNIGM